MESVENTKDDLTKLVDIQHNEHRYVPEESNKEKNVDQEEPKSFGDHTVAKHYNELQEQGREKRTESRIFYLRNFNNWIKSMLIKDTIDSIKRHKKVGEKIVVLDLCCGKGGDLLKWKQGAIHHLVCADIAGTSVEQCLARYGDMARKCNNRMYTAEFITCDCTKVRLRDHLERPDLAFDLVSCQFSFHYCFESFAQADMMLRNVSENLNAGGYFVGTTPDARQLVSRLQESPSNSFGNDVYRITFPEGKKDNFDIFGAQYDFHLEGVVDCPEFLVYFPAFERLARKYGLKLVYRTPFPMFADKHLQSREGRQLLERMQALEPYPSERLVGHLDRDYNHAKEFANQERTQHFNNHAKIGTLSQSEWDATSVYLVFAFIKSPTETLPQPSHDPAPAPAV